MARSIRDDTIVVRQHAVGVVAAPAEEVVGQEPPELVAGEGPPARRARSGARGRGRARPWPAGRRRGRWPGPRPHRCGRRGRAGGRGRPAPRGWGTATVGKSGSGTDCSATSWRSTNPTSAAGPAHDLGRRRRAARCGPPRRGARPARWCSSRWTTVDDVDVDDVGADVLDQRVARRRARGRSVTRPGGGHGRGDGRRPGRRRSAGPRRRRPCSRCPGRGCGWPSP